MNFFQQIKFIFRKARYKVIRLWRLHTMIPKLLRFNAYTGYVGRRLFQYIPFLLPHDKSYYGFAYLVKPGDGLFLDVGANDGISAIGFHHIHSDYRILSLEPNRCHEASLRRLVKKLKAFDYRIIGAGDKTKRMTLYVPFFQGVPIYTAASFNLDFVKRSMSNQFNESSATVVYQEYITDIIAIDELGLKPDIVKIDTEGYDLVVLQGMFNTIEKYRPVVMVEFNPDLFDREKEYFKSLDYQFYSYCFKSDLFEPFNIHKQTQFFNKRLEAQNIFCIPSEKTLNLPGITRDS